MFASKYLTASLTALAVVGSASFVFAQTTPTPATPGSGDITSPSPADSTLNQGTTTPGTGTLNQGTTSPDTGTTMGQGTDTTNQGTNNMAQDRSMDEQLAARADRN